MWRWRASPPGRWRSSWPPSSQGSPCRLWCMCSCLCSIPNTRTRLRDVYNRVVRRLRYVLLCLCTSKSTCTHILQSYEHTKEGCITIVRGNHNRMIITSYDNRIVRASADVRPYASCGGKRTIVRYKSYDRTMHTAYDRTIGSVRSYA